MKGRRSHIRDVITRVRAVLKDYNNAGLGTHASSTAYYFFVSIIPIAIILAFVVSNIGFSKADLAKFMHETFPDVLGGFMNDVIDEAYGHAQLTLSFSVVTLLWTASKGATALFCGLNAAYGVKEDRSVIRRVVLSITSIIVFILLVAAAMYLIFEDGVVKVLSSFIPRVVGPDIKTLVIRSVLLFTISVIAFVLCFTYLPAGKRRISSAIPGTIITAVSWFIFSVGFRIYVGSSTKYTLIYGSLATIVMLLLWLYCIFLILLVGGYFNKCCKPKHLQKILAWSRSDPHDDSLSEESPLDQR